MQDYVGSHPSVIGVLCIDLTTEMIQKYGQRFQSYISPSYVSFLESVGANVTPVWMARSETYYKDIMRKINGILLPGGAVFFDSADNKNGQTNYYVESVRIIYRIAKEMYEEKVYFPVVGICLGFQLLLNHSAGRNIRQDCSELNTFLPLELEKDYKNSKMFKDLPDNIYGLFKTADFAFHFHRYCITNQDLIDFGIAGNWKVTSTNEDAEGLKFISTIEHKTYPLYGSQFHPEKVIFESESNIQSYTDDSIMCAKYMANFLATECRKNSNHFSNDQDRERHLISQFEKINTGSENPKYTVCYLFSKDCDYPKNYYKKLLCDGPAVGNVKWSLPKKLFL